MARREGTLKLSSNIEPRAAAPLDARTIVPTLADLTASGAFPYPYVGMIVSVQATGKAYMLTEDDTTVSANWKEIGGSSGDSVPALDTVPENPEEGDVFLYTGETTASFAKGCIYQYQTNITTKRTLAIHEYGDYERLMGYYDEQGEYQSDTSSWTNLTLIRNTSSSFNDGTYTYHLAFKQDTHRLLTYNMTTGDRYSVTLDLYSETDPVFAINEPIVREGVLDFGFTSIWSYDIVDTGWKQISPNTFNEDDFTITNNEVSLKHKEWTGTHDEWDAFTSAEKAVYDGCKINFTDDDEGSEVQTDVYSTTETKTNKVWIDGKPIYRKVIDLGTLPNANTDAFDVPHGVSNLGSRVSIQSYIRNTSTEVVETVPNYIADNDRITRVRFTDTSVRLAVKGYWSGYTGYAILEYTKTSD